MEIKATESTPKYLQLKSKILDMLSDSEYYSPLPGEREFCELFDVSRPTIRKTLELLEEDKKIIKISGKGSFYLGNKTHVDSSSTALNFYNEVYTSGKYTSSKVLIQNVEISTKDVALRLNIDIGEEVFHLERLRYIDGELYSLANAYLPIKICPELLKIDFTNTSLYDTLEKHDVYPYKLDKILEIKPANSYEAIHLDIESGSPVSVMQTISRDKNDRIIEYAISKSSAYKTRYEMVAYNTKNRP